jgi:rhodanese-related sulfurtransferase
VAIVIGLGGNALRETPLSLTAPLETPPPPEAGAGLPASPAADALASWEEGAFFLDLRPREEWEADRVFGSLSVDSDLFEDRYFEVVADLDPSLPLFLYGAVADSHSVRRTAARLEELGHTDVRFVVSGLAGLRDAGLETVQGPEESAP